VTSITIVSQKGGVGKTTLALNLAHSLARRGWKTLLADSDPQGAIGLSLSRKTRGMRGLLDCLEGKARPGEVVLKTREPLLDVLTAGKRPTLEIAERSAEYYNRQAVRRVFQQAAESGYEILLMDTPAGFFGPTMSIVMESDFLLAPQQAEPLAIRSAPQILETIRALQDQGLPAHLLGLVLTMVQRGQEESAGVLREVRNSLPEEVVLETVVPRDAIFLKASARGVPVSLLQKNPPAAALVFDQIAAEIEKRAELGEKDYEPGQRVLLD
jgi:chromosome partitioning protein